MEKQKILVVGDLEGSGAREDAIVAKLAESPHTEEVFWVSPNAGANRIPKVTSINITTDNFDEFIATLIHVVKNLGIDFTFVGPEGSLFAGIVDRFEAEGLSIIGPSRKAAFFTEASKDFCKGILGAYGIPTAPYFTFSNRESARAYLETYMAKPGSSCVIKANGPAKGKGVSVVDSLQDAFDEVERIFALDPGGIILIEERLVGWELSYIVAIDGEGNISSFVPVQDYKDLGGRMTGGMGARTVPELSQALRDKIDNTIVRPTIEALRSEGIPYKGYLYFGLMIVEEDEEEPNVLELNCRLGDPETQVILSCLKSDFVEFCVALLKDELDTFQLEWSDEEFVAIVLASPGYPENPQTGDVVYNLDQAELHARVYYAGLDRNDNGDLVTAGGRVLTVVSSGDTLKEAKAKAVAAACLISFGDPDPAKGTQVFRTDIASDA